VRQHAEEGNEARGPQVLLAVLRLDAVLGDLLNRAFLEGDELDVPRYRPRNGAAQVNAVSRRRL
jgi:hypothetical protein